tara:strand:- start:6093 stop:6350 length:258 start_codon:yes stop_codon:yes gene_type:complete
MATSIDFKKKYKAEIKDMLIFDTLLINKRDDYDSVEEAYHMLRYDYMKHAKVFLPANYARFRGIISLGAKKILANRKRFKYVTND